MTSAVAATFARGLSPQMYDLSWGEAFTKGPILYEKIRSELEAKYPGQHALIDIVSGEYEIDQDEVNAARRLNQRFPDVKPWTVKIAVSPAARRRQRSSFAALAYRRARDPVRKARSSSAESSDRIRLPGG